MTAENQGRCANSASAPSLSDWRAFSKTIGRMTIAFSSEVASVRVKKTRQKQNMAPVLITLEPRPR
jgi:hypothetical protein